MRCRDQAASESCSSSNNVSTLLKAETQLHLSFCQMNPKSVQTRVSLAKLLCEYPEGLSVSSRLEAMRLYREARHLDNRNVDATVGLGDMLKQDLRPEDAIREMAKFPDPEGQPTFDDSFVHVEIVRTIIATAGRSRASPILKSPHLEKSLVIAGRVMGFDGISKYVEALDAKGQWDLLRRVYATINQRSLSDPSMLSFFKVVGWDN